MVTLNLLGSHEIHIFLENSRVGDCDAAAVAVAGQACGACGGWHAAGVASAARGAHAARGRLGPPNRLSARARGPRALPGHHCLRHPPCRRMVPAVPFTENQLV